MKAYARFDEILNGLLDLKLANLGPNLAPPTWAG